MMPRRGYLATRFMLFTAFAFASTGLHAQDANADIYGKWKIKAMIGGGAVGSLSQRQVDRLIGKFAIISAERFEFNGRTCMYPKYERTEEETVSHFDQGWRTDVSDIPFPNPVTIIDTDCDTLYPIRKDHLMIAEGGVFFEAVRVKSESGHRTSKGSAKKPVSP